MISSTDWTLFSSSALQWFLRLLHCHSLWSSVLQWRSPIWLDYSSISPQNLAPCRAEWPGQSHEDEGVCQTMMVWMITSHPVTYIWNNLHYFLITTKVMHCHWRKKKSWIPPFKTHGCTAVKLLFFLYIYKMKSFK